MNIATLVPAYILHRRSYRETSFLVEVFSETHGRLSLIARGARQSARQGLLQPFTPVLLSWKGKQELMTLTDVELGGDIPLLKKEALYAGFYLNELLMHLLQKWDPQPVIFAHYMNTLQALEKGLDEIALRLFEKKLVEEIGYGLLAKSDLRLQETLLPDKYYRYIPLQGLVLSEASSATTTTFLGDRLLAIQREDWQVPGVLQDAKRLMRIILTNLLESKPINSRKLFS